MKFYRFIFLAVFTLGIAVHTQAAPFAAGLGKNQANLAFERAVQEAVQLPKGRLQKVAVDDAIISRNLVGNKAAIAFNARGAHSVHPTQMVFKQDRFFKINPLQFQPDPSGNAVTLTFDPALFELRVVHLYTKNYNVERAVMLTEVSNAQTGWDVSVSFITQTQVRGKEYTSFYFLIPQGPR